MRGVGWVDAARGPHKHGDGAPEHMTGMSTVLHVGCCRVHVMEGSVLPALITVLVLSAIFAALCSLHSPSMVKRSQSLQQPTTKKCWRALRIQRKVQQSLWHLRIPFEPFCQSFRILRRVFLTYVLGCGVAIYGLLQSLIAAAAKWTSSGIGLPPRVLLAMGRGI